MQSALKIKDMKLILLFPIALIVLGIILYRNQVGLFGITFILAGVMFLPFAIQLRKKVK